MYTKKSKKKLKRPHKPYIAEYKVLKNEINEKFMVSET